jgi:DNA adenine methylase
LNQAAYFDAIHDWYTRVKLARPFLKWAGGKQPFLLRFGARFPSFQGRYIEPFLGSGSVFFYNIRNQRRPFEAVLGDTNLQLIRTFVAIRQNPVAVYERLQAHQTAYDSAQNKATYYNLVRDIYNSQLPKVDSADFIFLNRTGWNGLYRVNQAGRYNVPYGNPKTSNVIPSREDLINVSAALAQADLRATTWENTISLAEPGDFVFLDPPYYSDVIASSAKYSKVGFSKQDHEQLARSLQLLDKRHISFVLTNSGESDMQDLYRSYGLHVETIEIPRSISSKTDARLAVTEIVVTAKNLQPLLSDKARSFFPSV